ncbi:N-carbamoyl-D-amino-acid hydrolase (plasmid) [Nitratireductor sp. GZWM139]|nr:N-carbamoyl-D-amino-acid hydrolase [Nitratireductor sp. GZWM139]MDJ1466031.1 N-carbamoyl-D-amino-acid hydrolase [Nitratireductor sp. GZWM139]
MTRKLRMSVAQLGPIARAESRKQVVSRMLELFREAAALRSEFVVFPELALTTFFPRWYITDESELDAFYEAEMPNSDVMPLFEAARELSIRFCLGYGEIASTDAGYQRFNTSILVNQKGEICGKYRKVHLPGHYEHEPERPFQHLEKRYFEVGDLGFPVFDVGTARIGMYICNDRRWPELWRSLGLQGAEIICGGYNTPTHNPVVPQHDHLASFHHLLSMQAGAYQNGAWAAAAAKAGIEEGCSLLAHSCIVAPTGEIVALSSTVEDELITATCDLDLCRDLRDHIFNFAAHRQPQHYGRITAR